MDNIWEDGGEIVSHLEVARKPTVHVVKVNLPSEEDDEEAADEQSSEPANSALAVASAGTGPPLGRHHMPS